MQKNNFGHTNLASWLVPLATSVKGNIQRLCNLTICQTMPQGAVHKRRWQLGWGGGVKNWSKLPTDSTKKLPTWGMWVSKIRKNCRRRLWMVPKDFEKLLIMILFWSYWAFFCNSCKNNLINSCNLPTNFQSLHRWWYIKFATGYSSKSICHDHAVILPKWFSQIDNYIQIWLPTYIH